MASDAASCHLTLPSLTGMSHNLARETFAGNVTERDPTQGELIVREPESGPRVKRSGSEQPTSYVDLKLAREHKENTSTEFKTPVQE